MTLIECGSPTALADFIRSKPAVVVTFSAHWCGPCRASKPALEALAGRMHSKLHMGIVYEDVLGDVIHHTYHIRAFPTHVLFVSGSESQRVEGANIPAIEAMMETYLATAPSASFETGGETLGGTLTHLSPAEARLARLAKLSAASALTNADAIQAAKEQAHASLMEEDDVKPTEKEKELETTDGDVEMEDANDETKTEEVEEVDPTATLNPEFIQTLTETMGFTQLRAQKGLLYGTGGTIEGAVEWLMDHQDDADIDAPIAKETRTVQSYKCNECGRILSNMANLELHANKTGHSDFEESTECIKPMTEEEKVAKIAEIKQLLKLKRAEREEAEKVGDVEREIQRRMMGKEMAKTKEQLEAEQRKRETQLRKKEKADFLKERQRLREELARDKAERASGKGKLSSRLGVDGYKPDGVQYDVPGSPSHAHAAGAEETDAPPKPKKVMADASKIDEYIAKVASYRAGGDGGNCLKILKTYIGNVVDHPTEEKYKTINMENKAYKTKVKPFIGAKSLLLACGFAPPEGGNGETLVLLEEGAHMEVLTATRAKLEAAFIAFNK